MKMEGKITADQGNGKYIGPMGEKELGLFEDQEGHMANKKSC